MPLWQKIAIIIGAITGVSALILGTICNYTDVCKHDFDISLEPMLGTVQLGGQLSPRITVNRIGSWDHVVTLANVLDSENVPQGILVTIKPPFGDAKPTYTSNILINVDKTVPIGEYHIKILGTGQSHSNMPEHSTRFILYVREPGQSISTTNFNPVTKEGFLDISQNFYASGWMGSLNDITLGLNSTINPHSEYTCIRINYSAKGSDNKNWAGIYWQFPDNNWGDKPEGLNMSEFSRVTFWARGENGGEIGEFKVGGIDGKALYPDSIQPANSTGDITLSRDWQKYTIDLTGQDLNHVIGGFCWVTTQNKNPNGCTIYLDDMRFEK